jgi:hypothetical protein
MKLKHKKVILLTLMSTMGVGVLTLSLPTNDKASKEIMKQVPSEAANTAFVMSTGTDDVAVQKSTQEEAVLSLSPTPSPIPTPTPLPVYDLEEGGYPEIDTLITDYYMAKLKCDVDGMKIIMSDPSNIATKKQMKQDVTFVEDYKNLKCYVKKGLTEGTYIVYTYNEIKFYNLKTPAPSVDKFYIATDESGNLKIYSGIFDDQTVAYYNDRDNDADVQKLIGDTLDKCEKAKEKDKALKAFWEKLESIYGNSEQKKSE